VAEHSVLNMFRFEWLAQQWVRLKVNHPQRQVIAGSEESMYLFGLFLAEGRALSRGAGCPEAAQVIEYSLCRDHKSSIKGGVARAA
jgi:hypothetical protein